MTSPRSPKSFIGSPRSNGRRPISLSCNVESILPEDQLPPTPSFDPKSPRKLDVEYNAARGSHAVNDLIYDFSWKDVRVDVREKGNPKWVSVLSNSLGLVRAGEVLGIMGPTGSGKTALLRTLAQRHAAPNAVITGTVFVNGQSEGPQAIRDHCAYVQQQDALVGGLTVQETMNLAARLAFPWRSLGKDAFTCVEDLIDSFGLQAKSNTIVGTVVKKGLDRGERKRLDVASRLLQYPKILFLENPTHLLDAGASYEVMKSLRNIAKRNNLIIIATVQEPPASTFNLFDKVCLLSQGKTCYFGSASKAPAYFSKTGYPIPWTIGFSEFYQEIVSVRFHEHEELHHKTDRLARKWATSMELGRLIGEIEQSSSRSNLASISTVGVRHTNFLIVFLVLLHRFLIKAFRDVLAYGMRFLLYIAFALVMGTVFLRLGSSQLDILPFSKAIFFVGAFMSYMSATYVYAFLEDCAVFYKERNTGLVGPLAFVLSSFISGLPFLFLIVMATSSVGYFLTGFRADVSAFFMWILWLFLDLIAAESIVVFVCSLFPSLILATTAVGCINIIMMCANGFLMPGNMLNPFWRYVFHYVDYQTYVFEGLMVNEFEPRIFTCSRGDGAMLPCLYSSSKASEGLIPGSEVLTAFDIRTGTEKRSFTILVAIIVTYRLLAYLSFRFGRRWT